MKPQSTNGVKQWHLQLPDCFVCFYHKINAVKSKLGRLIHCLNQEIFHQIVVAGLMKKCMGDDAVKEEKKKNKY